MRFSEYERELMELDEQGLIEANPPSEAEMYRFKEAAKRTINKDKRINIRMSSRDLTSLQRRANRFGMPYQTLISSVLHRYLSGELREVMIEPDGGANLE
jgi:predicted DNA binding CopG/RHH family protein